MNTANGAKGRSISEDLVDAVKVVDAVHECMSIDGFEFTDQQRRMLVNEVHSCLTFRQREGKVDAIIGKDAFLGREVDPFLLYECLSSRGLALTLSFTARTN